MVGGSTVIWPREADVQPIFQCCIGFGGKMYFVGRAGINRVAFSFSTPDVMIGEWYLISAWTFFPSSHNFLIFLNIKLDSVVLLTLLVCPMFFFFLVLRVHLQIHKKVLGHFFPPHYIDPFFKLNMYNFERKERETLQNVYFVVFIFCFFFVI